MHSNVSLADRYTQHRIRPHTNATFLMIVLASSVTLLPILTASTPPSTFLEQGFQFLYDFQFEDAKTNFSRWQQLFPDDPVGPAAEAAGYLFEEFNRLGILEVHFFTRRSSVGPAKKQVPDPARRSRFNDAVRRARQIANKRLETNPNDADALFAMALAAGQEADYQALIEKRTLASLENAKQATTWSRRLLAVDPRYYDAYLASGSEKYIIGSLIPPVRWLVGLTGVSGDKAEGIHELKLTAQHGHYLAPLARILLATAYIREHKDADARALVVQLKAEFPHNTIFPKVIYELDRH